MKTIQSLATSNTPLYFRGVLFLTFLGHGLVSLGFSPTGHELHRHIFESVNYFHWDAETFLRILGCWETFCAVIILSGFYPRLFLPLALCYLCVVAVVCYLFYHAQTGSYFGFAEIMRRLVWVFYAAFLWMFYSSNEKRFSLLRIGIACAFLAHGMASLGFFGFRTGQIELAKQVFDEQTATTIIFYSGFSDVTLGTLLLTGISSRVAAAIGCCWLVIVVILSFMLGVPEGLFRSGFLFSCIYVALDARCHTTIWEEGVIEKNVVLSGLTS